MADSLRPDPGNPAPRCRNCGGEIERKSVLATPRFGDTEDETMTYLRCRDCGADIEE